jgi:hypothetical protein
VKALLALSVAAIVVATGSPTWARLGETEEQCEHRYGKPLAPKRTEHKDLALLKIDAAEPVLKEEKFLSYKKDGTFISIGFIEGKAVSIQYWFDWKNKTALERDKIEGLLKLNAPGCEWYYDFEHPLVLESEPIEKPGKDGGVFWSTDGQYYAFFSRVMPIFKIMRAGLRPVFRFDQVMPLSLEGF